MGFWSSAWDVVSLLGEQAVKSYFSSSSVSDSPSYSKEVNTVETLDDASLVFLSDGKIRFKNSSDTGSVLCSMSGWLDGLNGEGVSQQPSGYETLEVIATPDDPVQEISNEISSYINNGQALFSKPEISGSELQGGLFRYSTRFARLNFAVNPKVRAFSGNFLIEYCKEKKGFLFKPLRDVSALNIKLSVTTPGLEFNLDWKGESQSSMLSMSSPIILKVPKAFSQGVESAEALDLQVDLEMTKESFTKCMNYANDLQVSRFGEEKRRTYSLDSWQKS